MGRIVTAAVVAIGAAVLLGQVRDPREAAGVVAPALVAWGAAVAWLLRGAVAAAPAVPPDAEPAFRSMARVFAVACLVRLPFLRWPATLSDDVFRYVWEGRVWAAGFSPFALAPDDPTLAALRDDVWAQVNHPGISTIYPPLAQALFVLLAPGGVMAWKVTMALADAAAAALLWQRRPNTGWLWALLPLPAVESAANGHLEGLGVLLVVLALRGSAVAAWAGAMLKLLPAVFLARRGARVWAAAGVATVLAFLPLVGPGFTRAFQNYSTRWSFNGSVYPLLAAHVADDARLRAALAVGGAAIVALAVLRLRDPARVALWSFGAFVVLSPTVHPWYVLWPLVPALWLGHRAWTVLAVTAPLSYLVLTTRDVGGGWHEAPWVRAAEYLPFFAVLLAEAWRRWSRPGP